MYGSKNKKVKLLKSSETLEISLEPFDYELLTVSPVTLLTGKSVHFAPIGLVNMLNTGGAIQLLAFDEDEQLVRVGVKGCGEFRVFASVKPRICRLDGVDVDFEYDDFMVTVQVPWPDSSRLSVVEYLF